MKKTLKQISIDNGVYYGTVYQSMSNAGLIVRRTKNNEYEEQEVLLTVYAYLQKRIEHYEKKITDLNIESQIVLKAIEKVGVKKDEQ